MVPSEPYVLVARTPVDSPKRMWMSKLILRAISAAICIILFGIGGHLATFWSVELILVAGPTAGIAVIFDVAESICLLVRRGHRGMHPGACVAVDLILWLGFTGGAVYLGFFQYYFTENSYYYYDEYDREDYRGMETASLAFVILNTIVHFVIFVLACHETRMRSKATQIYYAPAMVQGATQPINYVVPAQTLSPAYYPPQMISKPGDVYVPEQNRASTGV